MEKGIPKKIYLVWQETDKYFALYDSLQDAVTSEDDDVVEIFEATPKRLGKYRQKLSAIKVREK